jgi:predicted amidohydrolase
MAKQKTKHAIDSGNTAAVVQAASVAFDCKRSLAKALDLIRDASKKGAKLVLFPEAFLSGYPRGLDFGAVIGSRSQAGRDDFRRYWESAVDVPGPVVEMLGKAARSNRVLVVMGVVERAGASRQLRIHCDPQADFSILFRGCHGARRQLGLPDRRPSEL